MITMVSSERVIRPTMTHSGEISNDDSFIQEYQTKIEYGIVQLRLCDLCHRHDYFLRIFTQTLTFYWLYRKILMSWIRNNVEVLKKSILVKLQGKELFRLWDTKNMTSSKGVRTCHHICRLLRRSLVVKIHPSEG